MKMKKAAVIIGIGCMLNVLASGCSSGPVPAAKEQESAADEGLPEESDDTQQGESAGSMNEPKENHEGKWHVLEPEIAAAIDADFMGKVRKITEDSFFIAETKVKILDDGSLSTSSPSSSTDIPDSRLIQVVFDGNTQFYVGTSYGGEESYEDAKFQDLEEHMPVKMKGMFEDDVFYATEIRILNVS